ncbi:MAG TPA: alpha/beta fold hydrolase [Thermodesulfobacteriota bacterium]|nr:alpha/beta fold hydrolase [Thermodesulfobacteriota bacterium]
MIWHRILWLAGSVVISGYLALKARADESPQTRQLRVNSVDLSYIEQGTGAPVVFVHGAFSDLRFWKPQRQAVAKQYRFIAYNHRYHGTDPWPDDGKNYSAVTHAADLATLIRKLNAGPAHIVAISYGGLLATLVAAEHPVLVRKA